MSGPGFTTADLVSIAAFAANYFIVAPASVACVVVGVVRRHRGAPTWLVPIAVINVLVAGIQLVLMGPSNMEWWLVALLVAQLAAAVGVIAWVTRLRRGTRLRSRG